MAKTNLNYTIPDDQFHTPFTTRDALAQFVLTLLEQRLAEANSAMRGESPRIVAQVTLCMREFARGDAVIV